MLVGRFWLVFTDNYLLKYEFSANSLLAFAYNGVYKSCEKDINIQE